MGISPLILMAGGWLASFSGERISLESTLLFEGLARVSRWAVPSAAGKPAHGQPPEQDPGCSRQRRALRSGTLRAQDLTDPAPVLGVCYLEQATLTDL